MRQVSRAEAERLGGATPRPPRDEVEWTNPRTGETMRVDRGVDPSWAGNPGIDRPRLLAEAAARGIDDLGELSAALGREAVRQVAGSSLLERQLAPSREGDPPKGPLPVGYLEAELRSELGTARRVILLDSRGVRHLAARPEITPAAIRDVLPRLIAERRLVLRVTDHGGQPGSGLAFFGPGADGSVWKAAVRVQRGRLRLATMHRSSIRNAEDLLAKGAGIAAGSLDALR